MLVLRAQHFDLGDIGHVEQPRACGFNVVAQLAERKAIRGEAINDTEGAAKVVIKTRADDSGRQRCAYVSDVLADLVPHIGHLGRWGRLLQVDENRRLASSRVAAHTVKMGCFLQLAFEPLGDLEQGLVDGGSRPGSAHHHGANGEGRIFPAPQSQESERARHHGDEHQKYDE